MGHSGFFFEFSGISIITKGIYMPHYVSSITLFLKNTSPDNNKKLSQNQEKNPQTLTFHILLH